MQLIAAVYYRFDLPVISVHAEWISFFLTGKSALPTASVIRVAKGATEQGYAPLLEVAKPHVNNDEKHVSSVPVIVLSAEDEKLIDDVRDSTVMISVPAAVKRLMGKKTGSQRKRGAKGDGVVYTIQNIPSALFKPIMSANSVFRVTQEVFSSGYTGSSVTVPVFTGLAFVVNSLDQISHLTALFDQYRIVLVEVWLCPQNAQATVNFNGNLATVIDYDDDSALSTVASALDYVNVVSTNALFAHYRKFVPHVAVAAYSGAFTSFMNVTAPWIDAASPSVKHYGFKSALSASSNVLNYDLTYRLTTEWRNVR
jgi:hypothetical protein